MPNPNGVDIANMYVGYNGIEPQKEGESNYSFRQRVAGVLRNDNKIVDAHEVINNRYHDEQLDDDTTNPVVDGICGAAALALSGHGDIKSTVIDEAANKLRLKRYREERNRDGMINAYMMLLAGMNGGR